jgi:hypothetical protein
MRLPGSLAQGLLVRYQTQAVLRRKTSGDPLRLVGVTLDNTFFGRESSDATEPLVLKKGLVALAPLTPVVAEGPAEAATIAMDDARDSWTGLERPESGDLPPTP